MTIVIDFSVPFIYHCDLSTIVSGVCVLVRNIATNLYQQLLLPQVDSSAMLWLLSTKSLGPQVSQSTSLSAPATSAYGFTLVRAKLNLSSCTSTFQKVKGVAKGM